MVVHGSVTGTSGGAITVRVDRVLKGNTGPEVRVFVGPGRGGPGPAVSASSVDYAAGVGTDHVLYVIKGEDGQMETNACIGSHPGGPTPDESAFFGAGTSPGPGGGAPGLVIDIGASPEPRWIAVVLAVALAVVGAIVVRRRRSPA